MAELLKTTRKSKKTIITKEINQLKRYMAEEENNEVTNGLARLKEKFRDFETSHNDYHSVLEDETEIDTSDIYFFDVQDNYIAALKSVKAWFEDQSRVKVQERDDVSVSSSDGLSHKELLTLLNLPKVELEPFDGDPLKYHSFVAVFDDNVDSILQDGRTKLTRLLQYTCGEAKIAIRPCSLIGGDVGYTQAREILKKRFGNHHLITEKIINNLKNGKQVKTPRDLQNISDELIHCHVILNQMKRLHEIDTQSCIVDIVNRLPSSIRSRWRRFALEQKRQTDSYPNFKALVEFVSKETDDATDPVYGVKSFSPKEECDDIDHVEVKPSISSFATKVNPMENKVPGCVLCGHDHHLFYCDAFKSLNPQQRYQFVKRNRLCENCLLGNHQVDNCRRSSVCSIEGCGKKHTRFIHIDDVNYSGSKIAANGAGTYKATSSYDVTDVNGQSTFGNRIPLREVT